MPAGLGARPSLLVFFHGDTWIPEVAAKSNRTAAISVLAGEGSGVYTRLFEDPQRFLRLLKEAEAKAHKPFGRVILGGWSAGCGTLHQILKSPQSYARVNAVICIDGWTKWARSPISRNITDRKRIQEEARKAGERFRFMAESMPQKIFTANATGIYILDII